MHPKTRHEHYITNKSKIWRGVILAAIITPLIAMTPQVLATAIYSAQVDRNEQKIIVTGEGFSPLLTVTLAGISVNTANVSNTELHIPFATAVYLAIQWEGSYNLVVDETNRLSIYIEAPILAPPLVGGPDCPCIDGWETAGLFPDTFLCGDGVDGTQSYIYGNSYVDTSFFISAAFDPNNIFFDENEPGNSLSFCALIQNNLYTVSEPVVNQEQNSDCFAWIWSNVCL